MEPAPPQPSPRGRSDPDFSSARIILGEVSKLVPFQSVLHVGRGKEAWLGAASEFGAVRVLGVGQIDVDDSGFGIGRGCFGSRPIETDSPAEIASAAPPFDLAICVHVAKHLAPERAQAPVSELGDLSELVLFSGAVSGENRTDRSSQHDPLHWATMFSSIGFDCFDCLRPKLWNEEGCDWSFIQSTFLYARRGGKAHKMLRRTHQPQPEPQLYLHARFLSQLRQDYDDRIEHLQQALLQQSFARDAKVEQLEAKVDRLRQLVASPVKPDQWRLPAPIKWICSTWNAFGRLMNRTSCM